MTGIVPAPLHGLLLSGGASRRMQRDKALLEYRGETQLLRAWRLLREVCEPAFVSMRAEQLGDPLRAGLPHLLDTYDAVGPVAGILSAQDAYPQAAWLVIACDLPLLDIGTLRSLLEARDPSQDATAFVSRLDGQPEPLCAIWEPSSHALLKQRFDAGRWCPRKALSILRTRLLPPPGGALDNINTPDELQALLRRTEAQA